MEAFWGSWRISKQLQKTVSEENINATNGFNRGKSTNPQLHKILSIGQVLGKLQIKMSKICISAKLGSWAQAASRRDSGWDTEPTKTSSALLPYGNLGTTFIIVCSGYLSKSNI